MASRLPRRRSGRSKKVSSGRTLALRGVVAAMNRARRLLGDGVSQSEAPEFLRWVGGVVSGVEEACRRHGTRPDRLAAPTRRAYAVLKSITDAGLAELPAPWAGSRGGGLPNPRGLGLSLRDDRPRVANLVAVTNRLRGELWSLVWESWGSSGDSGKGAVGGAGPTGRAAAVTGLLDRIRTNIEKVDDICRGRGGPALLPTQSRRAYQWLRFLSQGGNLECHLAAQESAARVASREGGRLRVDFYNMAGLFRLDPGGRSPGGRVPTGPLLTASEGFIAAPSEVIESLVHAALDGRVRRPGARNRHRARLAEFAAGEDFQDITLTLESSAAPGAAGARGRHYDLVEVFKRVNALYFGGRLDRPTLTWNGTLTRRKVGHYQQSRDVVMLSITLDDPAVPPYVVDFVMFHELLHKELGAKVSGGRRYVHTAAFRRAEKRFPRHAEAEKYLKGLR